MKKRDRENLNPTPEAVVAMNLWAENYAGQSGGSMDFWHGIFRCRKEAMRRACRARLGSSAQSQAYLKQERPAMQIPKRSPIPKTDCRYVRDDLLWKRLRDGVADVDDQSAAAEWIEWSMARVPVADAERRRTG